MDILSDGAVTFVVALLMAVGLVGIVLPIIPGSPLIAIATLLWVIASMALTTVSEKPRRYRS